MHKNLLITDKREIREHTGTHTVVSSLHRPSYLPQACQGFHHVVPTSDCGPCARPCPEVLRRSIQLRERGGGRREPAGLRDAVYQPTSPPITTSPPSTTSEDMSWLMRWGTTAQVIGNSAGAVFTTRTTLPEPGVPRKHRKGRSQPSSVYSSMTCLLLLGPWRSSMRALSGRPSVLRRTWTESTDGAKGYVRSAPPWMVVEAETHSADGKSTFSVTTLAAIGNSIWPMLRIATVLGPRGVSTTALKGRSWPFSTYTRILHGVLLGPCQSSISASSGRPSVLRTTCTCSTSGERYDQVRREPPCTRIVESASMRPRPVGTTLPLYPAAVGGGAMPCCGICITTGAMRRAGAARKSESIFFFERA